MRPSSPPPPSRFDCSRRNTYEGSHSNGKEASSSPTGRANAVRKSSRSDDAVPGHTRELSPMDDTLCPYNSTWSEPLSTWTVLRRRSRWF